MFSVDPTVLQHHVETLCQFPRHYLDETGLSQAADYIARHWEVQGFPMQRQPFAVQGQDFQNILVSLGPAHAPRFVIGAHYDVCVTEPLIQENPGADDNASGIAALLELAGLLHPVSSQLQYQVELVAYANEEPPFFRTEGMGSYVHARSLNDQSVPVRGMISLEMLGYFTDEPHSQTYPLELLKLFYPSTGHFIAVAGDLGSRSLVKSVRNGLKRYATTPVRSISAPAQLEGIDFSDHLNYRKFGWPAVMITDTAFYRNPHYHQPTDTPDTLNYHKMADIVQGLAQYVLNLNQ